MRCSNYQILRLCSGNATAVSRLTVYDCQNGVVYRYQIHNHGLESRALTRRTDQGDNVNLKDEAVRRYFVRWVDAQPAIELDSALVERLRAQIGPYRAIDENAQIQLVGKLLAAAGCSQKAA